LPRSSGDVGLRREDDRVRFVPLDEDLRAARTARLPPTFVSLAMTVPASIVSVAPGRT
jgi:hypothetical protein